MNVCDNTGRQPIKLRRMDINELGDGPHKANVETFVGNIAFANGAEIGLVFWWVELLVFFIKIRNYIFDCTFLGLGNLNRKEKYFRKIGNKLLSYFLNFRSLFNRIEDGLFFFIQRVNFEFGILE